MKKLSYALRIAEADGLATVLQEGFAGEAALKDDQFLTALFAKIKALSDELSEAANKGKVSSELERLDIERDEALRKLGQAISGYANIPVPALSEHGKALQAIFAKYGARIADLGYVAETGELESLFGDLDADDAKPHVEALEGMSGLLSDLKEAQAAFVSAQVAQGKTTSAEKEKASASEIRKPLVSLINEQLVPYLTMMLTADKARFGSFAAFVEGEIEKVNRIVAARKKSKPNAAPQE